MAQVLQGIPGVVYFIDDILVTGQTREQHEPTYNAKFLPSLSHVLHPLHQTCTMGLEDRTPGSIYVH